MKDRVKIAKNYSDRLVFECEFRDVNDMPLDVNTFELQVVWNTHNSNNLISNHDLVGRIYDLTLSFDRTL
jgi:hypothetical protein